MDSVRADKWLWAVRLYKTRALAAAACKLNRVRLGTAFIKPSRDLRPGDVLDVDKEQMVRTVKVLEILDKRVGAKAVPDFMEEMTSEEEWERARAARQAANDNKVFNIGGIGRPTKKYRRQIEEFLRDHGDG
ncbi:MAG: ribosome-associated heat shock protein Hsp15 [Verrucomicrobiales bacterium]|jgi:ribosome-associated heat shock protein Hsp15